MATFTDRHGREWRLAPLTLGDFPRFRAAGIDLNAALKGGEAVADLLFGDLERLGRCAWLFCEAEAAAAGVQPDDFAGGFDADTVERFGEALAETLADFAPRAAWRTALKGNARSALRQMDAAVVERLSGPPKRPDGGSPASSA